MTPSAQPSGQRRLPLNLEMSRDEFQLFRKLIYRHSGIHLSQAKRAMAASRLLRRLRALGLDSYGQYYDYLTGSDPEGLELEKMVNRITTNQTGFFRERHHFQYLAKDLLPLLRRRGEETGRRRLRAWSAACSTGQEAYSMALTVARAFENADGWDIRILATDLDTEVLKKASRGEYTKEEIDSMEPMLRQTSFKPVKDDRDRLVYRIDPAIRRMIVFRRFNLLRIPYPLKVELDIIFCRNVIIYFNRQDKTRLMAEMYRVLEPGGHLFIGHSESLMAAGEQFK